MCYRNITLAVHYPGVEILPATGVLLRMENAGCG